MRSTYVRIKLLRGVCDQLSLRVRGVSLESADQGFRDVSNQISLESADWARLRCEPSPFVSKPIGCVRGASDQLSSESANRARLRCKRSTFGRVG